MQDQTIRMNRHLKNQWFSAIVLVVLLLPLNAVASNALERMEKFFSNQGTYFAEFSQVILDEGLHLIEESTGLMWLSRPSRFRWEYFDPFEQTIVSDGRQIWVYDAELEQASVRYVSDVIDQSAAEILVGSGKIDESYSVEDLGIQGMLAWISIRPLDLETSQFESMRLGFDDETLRTMEILDTLGDTTRIEMHEVVLGDEFNEKVFDFEIPDGVDLIDSREEGNSSN